MSAITKPATRVALYARYSSDRQSENSIADQMRICRAHAERQGWDVTHCFEDVAIAGTSLDRPGYQALQLAMRLGKVDIVLAEALDRFSRDPEHTAGFYKQVKFTGVRPVTLADGAITDLHIGLKGTMNAMYLTDLAAKTRRGDRGAGASGPQRGSSPLWLSPRHRRPAARWRGRAGLARDHSGTGGDR